MRRIGEVIVTVAILTMVASLTVADQIRRKVSGASQKASTEVLTDEEGNPVESKSTSRADSVILHVL